MRSQSPAYTAANVVSMGISAITAIVLFAFVYDGIQEQISLIDTSELEEVGAPLQFPPIEYTLLLVVIPVAMIAFNKIWLFLSEHRIYPYSTVGVRHRVEVEDSSVDYCTSCGPRECGGGSDPQFGRLVEFDNGERRQFYRDTVVFGVLVRQRDDGENTYCRPCADDPIAAELRAERFDDLPEPSISVDDLDDATEAEA